MKNIRLATILLLSVFIATRALALKPAKSAADKSARFDLGVNLPEECTRSGEVTDALEIKCAKLRVELLNFYKEYPNAMALEQDKTVKNKKSTCEEVTESYVICHGNRYVLEVNAVSNTYKKVKDVTDIYNRDSTKPAEKNK